MKLRWVHVENALSAVGCESTRLLDDEGQWVRLIEQSELAVRIATVTRVAEHTAAEEVAMEIGDERTDIAHTERLSRTADAPVTPHQLLDRIGPVVLIRVV